MYIDPFVVINLAGIAIGLRAFYVAIRKTEKKISYTKFLSLLVLYEALIYTCYMVRVIYRLDFSAMIILFGPPLFFMYYCSRLQENTSPKLFYHFIPATTYSFYGAGVTLGLWNDLLLLQKYLPDACLAYICFYFLTSVYVYRQAQRNRVDPRTLQAVRKMFYPNLVFLFAVAFMCWQYRAYAFDHFLSYYTALVIYFISYALVKDLILISKIIPDKKYSRSSLDDQLKQVILKKIEYAMETEQYYTSNNASLPGLAKKIGTTPNHVSQVINECIRKNFFDLLASYRVERAKQIIADHANDFSIDAIADMVGYNSKSAFYTAFKKLTGTTPAEYKDKLDLATIDPSDAKPVLPK